MMKFHLSSLRRSLLAGLSSLLLAAPAIAAEECLVWPAWNNFRQTFVSEGGRVIDRASPQAVTTSEGQSYGLFFALVANDRASFDRILRWTEENLANNDLTTRLPAWLWGKRPDESWGILDDNAAADSDLWIAYVLAEAGRLWQEPRYEAMAELLAARILREETADIPGLGQSLLPGPKGFHPEKTVWQLNPSYVPLPLMRRMAALYPRTGWRQMVSPAYDLVVRSAPLGFSPEWMLFKEGAGFQVEPKSKGEGSYNAIRVYLWAGLMPTDDPLRSALLKRLQPMADYVAAQGNPPEKVDTRSGTTEGVGSPGFSGALLPFLAATQPELANQQRLRVVAKNTLARDDNYYDQVLTLFGLGWMDGQYRLGRNGQLQPRWTCASAASR